ncbi:hypothetical protein ApDm4_2470 [Acetobacter pomorum]|nr:hypothetical protein ApDm4_2470 [Acetobacter pomorum]
MPFQFCLSVDHSVEICGDDPFAYNANNIKKRRSVATTALCNQPIKVGPVI